MAVWSVVNVKEIDMKDRIDAEYFQPDILKTVTKIHKKNSLFLRSLAKLVTSAFYPAATEFYSIGEIPFIRCLDVIGYPVISDLQNREFERLPRPFIQENKTIQKLYPGDIIITKVGTPCYASVIDESLNEVALSRTVLGIKEIKIDPYYLVAFLRSKYGFLQLMRERELTIQLQLTLDRVGRIKVFIPLDNEQINDISLTVKEHFKYFVEFRNLYQAAENLLLEELGQKEFNPKYELSYSEYLSKVLGLHRIDAEYFQPVYNNLIGNLDTNFELRPLRKLLIDFQKGIEVGSDNYQEEGKPFFRVSNLSAQGFVERDPKYISEELYWQLKDVYGPKIGDLLLTKDATPGKAYVVKEPAEGIIASGILKLKINEREINKEYLALYINSIIGRMQIERDGGGSVITHWKPDQIKKLIVPILPKKTQQNIASLVQQAHKARKKAQQLLDKAKSKVEDAIENASKR